MVKDKYSFFLQPAEVEIFEYIVLPDNSVRIKIKGGKLKITLFADIYYERLAAVVKQELKK